MSASSELGIVALLVIMVIALLGQRNRVRPLDGRAAQITYGFVLTVGAVLALGALAIIAVLIANR
jgi:hypothetical protein